MRRKAPLWFAWDGDTRVLGFDQYCPRNCLDCPAQLRCKPFVPTAPQRRLVGGLSPVPTARRALADTRDIRSALFRAPTRGVLSGRTRERGSPSRSVSSVHSSCEPRSRSKLSEVRRRTVRRSRGYHTRTTFLRPSEHLIPVRRATCDHTAVSNDRQAT